MADLDNVWLQVSLQAGTNIPASGIPQLIQLANRLGCGLRCEANEVTILVGPGDDPIDLAVAWEQESARKGQHKIAVAWRGREHRVREAAALKPSEGSGR